MNINSNNIKKVKWRKDKLKELVDYERCESAL